MNFIKNFLVEKKRKSVVRALGKIKASKWVKALPRQILNLFVRLCTLISTSCSFMGLIRRLILGLHSIQDLGLIAKEGKQKCDFFK